MNLSIIDITKIDSANYNVTLLAESNVKRTYKLNINDKTVEGIPYHLINRRIGGMGVFGVYAKMYVLNEILPVLHIVKNEINYRELLKIFFYLKSSANSLFNQENIPVSLRIISQDLDIPEISTAHFCKRLHELMPSLVEEISSGGKLFYRVSVGKNE